MYMYMQLGLNCTGLFWASYDWGGGGGGGDLGPEGGRETWHAPQKLCEEKDLGVIIFFFNCIFY